MLEGSVNSSVDIPLTGFPVQHEYFTTGSFPSHISNTTSEECEQVLAPFSIWGSCYATKEQLVTAPVFYQSGKLDPAPKISYNSLKVSKNPIKY